MEDALASVEVLNEQYSVKTLVDFVTGSETKEMKDYRHNKLELFGFGKEKPDTYWTSVFQQAILNNLLFKEIEQYGVVKLTDKGKEYLENSYPIEITLNHNFNEDSMDPEDAAAKTVALDEILIRMLRDLRKTLAKQKKIPPYVIFQDPSLEDMATQYPITMDDMTKITGVSAGKAAKYARPFIQMIAKYVDENEIDRPQDFVIKQVANKSKTKVTIIQSIDKKIPLTEIARQNQLTMHDLIQELNSIVTSGTKVNLDYFINEAVDEYAREEIHAYFMTADTDDIEIAYKMLKDDDIRYEEIELMRLKFLSEMAN
jgi:ATP-dependent DNA helicase RecQ